VERLVRNSLWVGRTPERFYDAVEWLYAWRPAHCLDDAPEPVQPAAVSGADAAAVLSPH
jgi:salicylate hydroxylase